MIRSALLSFFLTLTSVPAAVVISEVLYNESGSDTGGEWIEIHNNGAVLQDLGSWKIGDEETSGGSGATEALFAFPAGSRIASGEVQVVAVNADRFLAVYGFLPDYELSGSASDNLAVPNLTIYSTWDPDGGLINLSNSNDQAVLLNAADEMADSASWGNTFSFDPALADAEADGQSYFRINPGADTDTAADWALTSGGANASTPGVVPEPGTSLLLAGLAAAGLAGRRRR